jgi:hypothetical protein
MDLLEYKRIYLKIQKAELSQKEMGATGKAGCGETQAQGPIL